MEKYLITNIKYSIEDEDISAYLEERDSSTLAYIYTLNENSEIVEDYRVF